jgi:hypothetical protein
LVENCDRHLTVGALLAAPFSTVCAICTNARARFSIDDILSIGDMLNTGRSKQRPYESVPNGRVNLVNQSCESVPINPANPTKCEMGPETGENDSLDLTQRCSGFRVG